MLADDIGYAVRALRHSRAFTAWTVGSLAIGITVTIAALAFLNAAMFLPFPEVSDQKRLVRVRVKRDCGRPDCWIPMTSVADYASLREGLHGLQGLAAFTQGEIAVALPEARSMRGAFTSANYFDVLGVGPVIGRVFNEADAERHTFVVVIAHRVWTREFRADPSVIGRTIRVGDTFVQIVGVAPVLFVGIDEGRSRGQGPDVWLPMWLADRVLPLTAAEQRQQERYFDFFGRLQDRVGLTRVQTEADVLASRLAASRSGRSASGRAEVRRVWRSNPDTWKFGVGLVMPIPILVLVIACVNAANLMLARGSQRQRDIAIRLAIGAGRARIIRQLLIESAGLALLATTVAAPVAWWSLRVASSPLDMPIPIDITVLTLTALTAVCTTLAFGLAPALRVTAQRPSSTLGSIGVRSDAAPRQSRTRRLLVIAQVALSLGLLATASQLVSTVRSQAVSGGTPPDQLLIARFDLRPLNLGEGDVETFYRDLVNGASRLPGVVAAGVSRSTSVWTFGQGTSAGSLVVWRPNDLPEDGRITAGGYAGGDLFAAIGLRVIAGRGFDETDRQVRPRVAVVNQTFAQSMNSPPIGSVLRVAPRGRDFHTSIEVRIVGVIEPAIEPRLAPGGRPAPKVYLPSPIQAEPALALYVRSSTTAASVAQPLRELASRIAPRVPILEVGSLAELNERSYGPQLWLARAAVVLGVIGLLLATAGLYGVSSYVVAMRSREIAIRMAVGATPRTILQMILRQSMRVAVIGLVIGAAAAAAVSRFIQSEYHGIQGLDGTAFTGATVSFVAAMLLASIIPAVRASRVDPVVNLKDG
jgi:predicted permease